MNLVRLLLFAVALAAIGGAAALAGRASGIDVGADEPGAAMSHGAEAGADVADAGGNGLSDTASGLRLVVSPTGLRADVASRLQLTIRDERGAAVTALDEEHGEPPLHLILVRRDVTGYLHLHPRRSGSGFAVDVTLPTAGTWRAYADFERDGRKTVLGRDLTVPGDFAPRELAAPAPAAQVDGYGVELDAGTPQAGKETTVSFQIHRGGRAVRGLEPYLGAAGHLVAIRADDLAYLHVHPRDDAPTGTIAFDAELAEPGRYALFLQFKHDGAVHTVPFTVEVAP